MLRRSQAKPWAIWEKYPYRWLLIMLLARGSLWPETGLIKFNVERDDYHLSYPRILHNA